jgi:Fe-S cluster biogenesis protein NfuA
MFIQTESTPNPNTLKFLPGRDVMGEGAVADFPSAQQGERSPLAKALFAIPEVARVFFGADFISVTKRDGDWKHLKPAILGAVMEHFTHGGDIIFKGFDGESGIVSLHMQGSCAGCPSSTMTLKNGIENMLRHYVPEVTAVEAV